MSEDALQTKWTRVLEPIDQTLEWLRRGARCLAACNARPQQVTCVKMELLRDYAKRNILSHMKMIL